MLRQLSLKWPLIAMISPLAWSSTSPLSQVDPAEQSTAPNFLYRNHHDFRCPEPFLGEDGTWIPSKALQKQLKRGIRAEFGKYTVDTENHIVQLCYHHGRLEVTAPLPYDVTLVTFGTVDRLSSLADTFSTWDGLVHVAIFIRSDDELEKLDKFLASHREARERLTVHLLWPEQTSPEGGPFPVNVLRNIALVGVSTTHFLYMDMDFVPSSGSRAQIIKQQTMLESIYRGKQRSLLILPAFECRRQLSGRLCSPLEAKYTTMTMQEVKRNAQRKLFDLFAGGKNGYHTSTEVEVWLATDKPYSLPVASGSNEVSPNFEPYAVIPTRTESADGRISPFLVWDEIFTDYGRNKIVFLSMLRAIFDYKFVVLPNVCVFHKRHAPTKEAFAFKKTVGPKERIIELYDSRMEHWRQLGYTLASRDASDHRLVELNEMPKVIQAATGDDENVGISDGQSNDTDWRRPAISPLLSNYTLDARQPVVDHDTQSPQTETAPPEPPLETELEAVEKKLKLAPSTLRLRVVEDFTDYFEDDTSPARPVPATKDSFERRVLQQVLANSESHQPAPAEVGISVLCKYWISINGLKWLLFGLTASVLFTSVVSRLLGRASWKGRRLSLFACIGLGLMLATLELFKTNCAISL